MRSIFQNDGKRTAFYIPLDLPNSVTGLLLVVIRATVELNVVVIKRVAMARAGRTLSEQYFALVYLLTVWLYIPSCFWISGS